MPVQLITTKPRNTVFRSGEAVDSLVFNKYNQATERYPTRYPQEELDGNPAVYELRMPVIVDRHELNCFLLGFMLGASYMEGAAKGCYDTYSTVFAEEIWKMLPDADLMRNDTSLADSLKVVAAQLQNHAEEFVHEQDENHDLNN